MNDELFAKYGVEEGGEEQFRKEVAENMTRELKNAVEGKVRQQVIATASVYLRRYYARNSLGSIDPLLLVPAALFLASKVAPSGFPRCCLASGSPLKVEEYGIISASKLVTLMQNIGAVLIAPFSA